MARKSAETETAQRSWEKLREEVVQWRSSVRWLREDLAYLGLIAQRRNTSFNHCIHSISVFSSFRIVPFHFIPFLRFNLFRSFHFISSPFISFYSFGFLSFIIHCSFHFVSFRWFIHAFIHSFLPSFIRSFMHSLIESPTPCFTRTLMSSLIH
jgi:hypothetical protein